LRWSFTDLRMPLRCRSSKWVSLWKNEALYL
jgi:hypothetical protein